MEPKKQMKLQNKDPLPIKKEIPESQKNPGLIEKKIKECRDKVQCAFLEFHKILFDKKLDQNKSNLEKDKERKIADSLFNSAVELDQINSGEGTMIVGSIALRELLKMRDRINEVEYKLLLTRKDLLDLQKDLGIKKNES